MTESGKDFSNFKIDMDIKNDEGKGITANGFDRNLIMRINKTDFNNIYDFVAGPRIILDNNKLNFNPKQIEKIIREIFTCSFCLEIFNEPVNIKNCLHKFCKKCIENYIRTTKKECIICREKIETRRILREDEKIKSIISCIIPNTTDYSKATDNYFNQNIKKFCLDDNKKLKIKEESLRPAEKEVKKETFNKVNKPISNIIKIECDLIPNLIKTESTGESNMTNQIQSNDKTSTTDVKMSISTKSSNNINESVKNHLNQKSDIEKSTNNLNTLIISKKTQRNDSMNEISSTKESHKKIKIDKEIKQYNITLEQAENQIKESLNILGVKLLCEKDSGFNLFNNLKLYTSDEITLEDFSLYILNKKSLNFSLVDRLNFYVYYSNQTCNLNKNISLKQIKELYKMDSENVNIYFNFK